MSQVTRADSNRGCIAAKEAIMGNKAREVARLLRRYGIECSLTQDTQHLSVNASHLSSNKSFLELLKDMDVEGLSNFLQNL